MSAHILVLDNDETSLNAYREALAPKASSWTLSLTRNTEDAKILAAQQPPDIAVASFHHDNGHGIQALSEIVDIAPMAYAFVTAKDDETNLLTEALEGGCRYLPENCPPDRILSEFLQCLAIDSWLENPVAKTLLEQRPALHSPPSLYLKILDTLRSPYASVDDISAAISNDLSLSTKILETVNTSQYGFGKDFTKIPDAVATLGISCVTTLVLGAKVFDLAAQSSEHQALINELWYHSANVANAARNITRFETGDASLAEDAFSAGLLHDIGKLVLLETVPDEYIEAQRLAREKGIPAWLSETQFIGCDHAEAGAYLLARWGLPQELCEAAALHHKPSNSSQNAFSLLAAVHAANAIVRQRKNAEHPDASPSQTFLIELGKEDAWQDWTDAAIGNPPHSTSRLKLNPPAETDSPPTPSAPLPTPTPEPPAQSSESLATARQELAHAVDRSLARQNALRHADPKDNSSRNLIAAFAAGALFCLCVVLMMTSGDKSPEPVSTPSTQSAKPTSKVAAAIKDAEAAGGSREKLLDTILDTNTPPPVVEKTPAPPPEPEPPPPPPPPPPFPEIQLSAIFQRTTGAKALVNGSIVGEGATVSGATIQAIHVTSITVEHYGRVKEIKLD